MIRSPRDYRLNKPLDSSTERLGSVVVTGIVQGLSLFGGSSYEKEVSDREGEDARGLRRKRGVVGLVGMGLHTGIGNGACSSGLMNDRHVVEREDL